MSRSPKNLPQPTNSPFKRMRLKARLTQQQLAQEIGVAVSTIRRWEKGQAEPTMTIAQTRNFTRAIGENFYDLPDSLLPTPPNFSENLTKVYYDSTTTSSLCQTENSVKYGKY